jgi:hypothetical protein
MPRSSSYGMFIFPDAVDVEDLYRIWHDRISSSRGLFNHLMEIVMKNQNNNQSNRSSSQQREAGRQSHKNQSGSSSKSSSSSNSSKR